MKVLLPSILNYTIVCLDSLNRTLIMYSTKLVQPLPVNFRVFWDFKDFPNGLLKTLYFSLREIAVKLLASSHFA